MNRDGSTPKHLLFFSRGMGRGHAVPDAAIAVDLSKVMPGVRVTFVSYSTGAETLRTLGCTVIDLDLPEDNPLRETALRSFRLIQSQRPSLIVSHEEFCVPPIAEALGIPSIFITDWFAHKEHVAMQGLQYADEILFMDDQGSYDEPPYLVGKIRYIGPVFRHLTYSPQDAGALREEWGVSRDATVVLVAPGGAGIHSESRAPLFDLVSGAFQMLPSADKHLIWIAGESDYGSLANKSRRCSNIRVIRPHGNFTATLLASNLVVTKSNRITVLESCAFGIPSISISYGINPIDDWRVGRVPGHCALKARGISQSALKEYFVRALAKPRTTGIAPHTASGRLAAVDSLFTHLSR